MGVRRLAACGCGGRRELPPGAGDGAVVRCAACGTFGVAEYHPLSSGAFDPERDWVLVPGWESKKHGEHARAAVQGYLRSLLPGGVEGK